MLRTYGPKKKKMSIQFYRRESKTRTELCSAGSVACSMTTKMDVFFSIISHEKNNRRVQTF